VAQALLFGLLHVRPLSFTLVVVVVAVAAACRQDQPLRNEGPPGEKTATTVIHASPRLTSIETSSKDGLGRDIRVPCVTCHGLRDAGAGFPEKAEKLREFHVGLTVQHGTLSCASCHVTRTGGAPMLRLSDGTEIATADTLLLCAQCHGPKYQDYLHGSHGGMNGHWDLSRGPRLRNHCVDCHDPHAPKFQPSRPVLPPMDRGAMASGAYHG
jgi:hypothetical protein